MTLLRRFLAGVVEFVVGDDWILAAGVVVTLVGLQVLRQMRDSRREQSNLHLGRTGV